MQRWAASQEGVAFWIVDDLLGLAPEQPIFAGIVVHQAFGLDDDHRVGLTLAEYREKVDRARVRMGALLPGLASTLKPFGKEAGLLGPHFVWSGPLCGGFLVKGVLQDSYPDKDLWFESESDRPAYESSRGARQDPASGGIRGAELYFTTYDGSGEPPLLTPELLSSKDEPLARAGLLKEARLFVLPHYDQVP